MERIQIQAKVKPIYKFTGSDTSCKYTMTPGPEDFPEALESCSWLQLLDALQEQERLSRAWDNTPEKGLNHTICYFIQRVERCWEFIPINVTKPFATTTICHVIEMMSMLGLIWTEFDMRMSTLTASGNGYLMTGENVPGLGTLFRFARLSKAQHQEHRVIPCREISKLMGENSFPSLQFFIIWPRG